MTIRKSSAYFFISLFSIVSSCGFQEDSQQISANNIQERVPGTDADSWKNEALVAETLAGANGVRVNVRSNYATYFENGQARAKWKVATARPGKSTPRGIFSIHHKDVCPPWSLNGSSAGPCAAGNPLGKKALWFNSGFSYGLHGVNAGAIWSVSDPNPRNRDQSSGCVRNHPENIEWLFEKVQVGTPVIVGAWDRDPDVVDCSGNASLCEQGFSPNIDLDGGSSDLLVSEPSHLPAECKIAVAAQSFANLRAVADTASESVSVLIRGQSVIVNERMIGESLEGNSVWYQVDVGEQRGFVHSSLLSCPD